MEDIFFISMDRVSGLEIGAKAIFPNVVVQRCIVHMIRNVIKYVPTKDYKRFTQKYMELQVLRHPEQLLKHSVMNGQTIPVQFMYGNEISIM